MTQMAVITPSFAPDFELCADLNRSILAHSANSVRHHIIVPASDLTLFRQLSGPRTRIDCENDFLPRSFVTFGRYTINLGRPFPPVRGWILQQILKLAAVAACEEDVALLVDSDIEFIRPFSVDTFVRDGVVRFYRKPDAINQNLPRHLIWHRVARSLLGLRPAEPPYNDYVSSLLPWNPEIVRRMLERVTATTGRSWTTAIAAQLHFSEWTLYGVFVDELMGGPINSFMSDDPLCLSYWGTTPLDCAGAANLLRGIRSTDVAAMISAKSLTPLAVRRAAFEGCRRAVSQADRHAESSIARDGCWPHSKVHGGWRELHEP